jgi:hypothetical protein
MHLDQLSHGHPKLGSKLLGTLTRYSQGDRRVPRVLMRRWHQ